MSTSTTSTSSSTSSSGGKRKAGALNGDGEEKVGPEGGAKRQATAARGFSFDLPVHRQVIGIRSDVRGTACIELILSAVRTGLFSQMLIIDMDCRNLVAGSFLPPNFMRVHAADYQSCVDFFSRRNENPHRFVCSDQPHVELVSGAKRDHHGMSVYASERYTGDRYYAEVAIQKVRGELAKFDVVLLHFGPDATPLDNILLAACDQVLQFVSRGVSAPSIINDLVETYNEVCGQLALDSDDPPPVDDKSPSLPTAAPSGAGVVDTKPRRPGLTIVPILHDAHPPALRKENEAFVAKIVTYMGTHSTDVLSYRGSVARPQSLDGVRPFRILQAHTEAGNLQGTKAMIADVRNLLAHCLAGTDDPSVHGHPPFRWSNVRRGDNGDAADEHALLVFSGPASRFRVVVAGPNTGDTAPKQCTWKRYAPGHDWKLYTGWYSTEAVVRDLYEKLIFYFNKGEGDPEGDVRTGEGTTGLYFSALISSMHIEEMAAAMFVEA